MAIEDCTQIPTTELREHESEIVNRVAYGKEEIVLTRHGKPIATLVSLEVLEALHRLEAAADVAAAAAARAEVKEHGTVSHVEVKARLGI